MEKILIVDDNSDILQQLKWGLSEDYAVILAGDVNEGIGLFKKNQPTVVILDLGLPPHEDTSVEGFRGLAELLVAALEAGPSGRSTVRRGRWIC